MKRVLALLGAALGFVRASPGLAWSSTKLMFQRFWALMKELRADRLLLILFGLLLLVDLGWTAWYGYAKYLYNADIDKSLYEMRHLRITTEGGWPEWYSYFKTAVLVLLLGRLAEAVREPIYAALTALFGLILLDDSLALHEGWGEYFAETFEIQARFGMRSVDFGELITWSIFAAFLLPLLGFAFKRSTEKHRGNGLALMLPFAGLVFCATFVDQLYHMYKEAFFGAGILLDMVEDGGEMVAVTFVTALVAVMVRELCGFGLKVGPGDEAESEPVAAEVAVLTRRQLIAGTLVAGLLGGLAMAYLNDFELETLSRYHTDLTQSPHWIAFHNDSFPDDDLFRRYGSFNETPLQNAIYWVGTLFVDVVPLEKWVGISIFALTAALFFLLVTKMAGPEAGALAALFYMIFPRAAYETAGGFSKAWAILFVLLAVYVVEQRSWSILPYAMPLAALAYPVSPVLMGAIVLSGLVLDHVQWRRSDREGWKFLVIGSLLGIAPLAYKYVQPAPFIGSFISTEEMQQKFEDGISHEVTPPLDEEFLNYVEEPAFIYGLVLLAVLLCRRGIVWRRSLSALVVASTVFFLIADAVHPRLYLPNRYTRFSVAVLLVLFFALNWSRVLEFFKNVWLRRVALVGIVFVTALQFEDTFKPCDGDRDLGCWEDKDRFAKVAERIQTFEGPVMLAGHPYTMAHLMVQSRRPVLLIDRMFHHWYDVWRETIDERAIDTFEAIYAREVTEINELQEKYGVTHLVVRKEDFHPAARRRGSVWRNEFAEDIREMAKGRERFVLYPPPPGFIAYEDERYWIVRLPVARLR